MVWGLFWRVVCFREATGGCGGGEARLPGPGEGMGEQLQLTDVAFNTQKSCFLQIKVKVDNNRLARAGQV